MSSQKNAKAAAVAKGSSKVAGSRGKAPKSGEKGGGFLSRQAMATKRAVTEAELLSKPSISPDDVLAMETASQSA